MKKFTILTFALLLSACAVGPPYPNERERRAQTYDDVYHAPYYDNNGYRCSYYNPTYHPRYDYYGNPIGYWVDEAEYNEHNWDGSNRYYNRNN
jgi:hypothetical protein